MAYKILLVDDDPTIYTWINDYNIKNRMHYTIRHIKSSEDIQGFIMNNHTDLILMAWMMKESDKTGIDILKSLKLSAATMNIPIIMCTTKDSVEDQVDALNQGADDYFRKSYPLELLYSKMNAILRKIDKTKNDRVILLRKFFFIDDALEVEHMGQRHKLTNKEFLILKTLVQNPKKVFSQEDLNKITSGEEVFISRRCIDTFVNLLRKKLGKDCIVSVRKKGYKLNENLLLFNKEEAANQ